MRARDTYTTNSSSVDRRKVQAKLWRVLKTQRPKSMIVRKAALPDETRPMSREAAITIAVIGRSADSKKQNIGKQRSRMDTQRVWSQRPATIGRGFHSPDLMVEMWCDWSSDLARCIAQEVSYALFEEHIDSSLPEAARASFYNRTTRL
jgi:hypothetical protein